MSLDKLGPQCSECKKSFSSRQGVVRHIVRHSSVRRFLCATCDSQFSHPSQLQQHMLSHSQTKTVLCDTCGRAFKTVVSRSRHMAALSVIDLEQQGILHHFLWQFYKFIYIYLCINMKHYKIKNRCVLRFKYHNLMFLIFRYTNFTLCVIVNP